MLFFRFLRRIIQLNMDIWIAAVGLLYFKTALVHEQLILYRRHGNNVSDGGFEKGYSLPNKIYRRLYRICCLIKFKQESKEE